MARRPFIAGNWKLNKGPAEAAELGRDLAAVLGNRTDIDIAVFPPTLSLASAISALAGSGIDIGVQEINSNNSGAYTGTNSPAMAREAGCTRCLIGHSERRQLYGETDEGVNKKVHAALAAGLLPILCIGETLDQRNAGQLKEVVGRQVTKGLEGLAPDQVATVTLAYEPVWAIGTGVTASPEQAQEAHAFIRSLLSRDYPGFVADQVRIQYGGSVKPGNARELLSQPDIDGALVGGASLKADNFAGIVAWAR